MKWFKKKDKEKEETKEMKKWKRRRATEPYSSSLAS